MSEAENPWDGSEMSCVGSPLADRQSFVEASPFVSTRDFYSPHCATVWQAFEALDAKKSPIDLVSTWSQIRELGLEDRLRQVGGESFLLRAQIEVITATNVAYHAKRVRLFAERRRWADTARHVLALASDQAGDLDAFFADAEGSMLRLLERQTTRGALIGSREGMIAAQARAEERYATRDDPRPKGVVSGIHLLDGITGGFKPPWLIILAARTGHGKSALAGNCVEAMAMAGQPSLVFSLEMGNDEWYDRMLATGGVDADRLRSGHLTTEDFKKLAVRVSDLGHGNMMEIDDEGELPIAEIRLRARRWRANQGRRCVPCAAAGAEKCSHVMVVIDYLQLAKGAPHLNLSPAQDVGLVSKGLKALAKELRCPVLALAQINRAVEKRENQRPTKSDLKDSGQIEQDADLILFLHREDEANPEGCSPELRGTAELWFGKGRNLPPARIDLLFQAQYARFVNPAPKRLQQKPPSYSPGNEYDGYEETDR